MTGNDPSDILGRLGVLGNANLFLINPNGIIFGENASLDVGGSFVATTANAIQLGEQGFFSASAPEAPPLLTVNPSAFLFNQIANGSIKNNSIAPAGLSPSSISVLGLRVPDGQSLLLVGGDVSLESRGRLNALGGRVELGGLAGVGTVGLEINGNTFSLSFTPDSLLSNVTLADDARVGVRGAGGGNIVVNANTFTATNGGRLVAGTEGLGNGGDITVNANNFRISGIGLSGFGAGLYSQVLERASGNAGNIFVNTSSFNASSGAEVRANTLGQGNAGSVNINARDTVSFDGGYAFSTVESTPESTAVGNSGGINITTGSLSVTNVAQLGTFTRGQGDAGDVNIYARDTVSFDGQDSNGFRSAVFSDVLDGAVGNGGDINITTGSLSMTNGARLQAVTIGTGDAGDVNIYARDTVSFQVSAVLTRVDPGAVGNSGDINITTGSLSVTDGAQLIASTRGNGDAGSVNIHARDTVSFDRTDSAGTPSAAFSRVSDGGMGIGGDVNITTGSLSVTDGASLVASTLEQGDSGDVNIIARNTVSFDGGDASSSVESKAIGNGGDINITTGSLSVTNGARLTASTFGQGDAGDMNIIARDTVSFYGIGSNGQSVAFSTVEPGAVGNGGDINIMTGSLFLTDSAILTTQTNSIGNSGSINIQAQQLSLSSDASLRGDVSPTGRGRGGNINLDVKGKILLTGASSFIDSGESTRITIGVLPGGIGSGGDLKIKSGSLVLTDGAIIKNSTQGQGSAGNIQVNADVVDISGSVPNTGLPSGLFTSTETTATGSAGNIVVDTQTFRVADGAALSARSQGDGQGGNITVNATSSFEAVNGGQLVTTAFGQGQAGNILVNADQVTVSGSDPNYSNRIAKFPSPISSFVANAITETGAASGLFASTIANSTGNGGNIDVVTTNFNLTDGAQVTVSSEGTGNAGNLEIASRDLLLNNRGLLRATTASGEGGNITLREQDLILMRRNSEISTTAGGTGNGGNIDIIDADLIVAVAGENSDIIANAFKGNGGKINITTQGIFGIEFREQRTPLSDITASSDFGLDGTVEINTPDFDPILGLVTLPAELVDVSGLVAQGCPGVRGNVGRGASEFIITGRGGLPPNPTEALRSDAVRVNLDTQVQGEKNRALAAISTNPISYEPTQIVEAQGWVIGANGEVMLTARPPTLTPHSPWITAADCHPPQNSS